MPISPYPPLPTRLRRTGLTLGAAGLLLAVPLTASAHVRVAADNPVTGSFSGLTFRVPNESSTASTIKVSVELPTDKPFLFVRSKPVPGWTVFATEAPLPKPIEVEGTTITKATRTVTWTAERGGGIKPEQYQEFSLSVGPLPDPGQILLPAIQTYSDGEVAHWDQPTPASGDEPENPAPTLEVTKAAPETAPSAAAPPPTTTTTSTASADGTARGLAGAALAVSIVGLVVGVLSLRRHTRPA